MEPWAIWTIVGLILVALEIVTPAFLMGALAVAAFVTALFAALGLSLTWQLVIFAAAAIITLAALRPVVLKYFSRGTSEDVDPLARMVGKSGRVQVGIDNKQGVGRVAAKGSTWAARSEDGEPIAADTPVRIVAVDGLTLIVEPVT